MRKIYDIINSKFSFTNTKKIKLGKRWDPINQNRLINEKQLMFDLLVRLETQESGSVNIEEITNLVDEMSEITSILPEDMNKYK